MMLVITARNTAGKPVRLDTSGNIGRMLAREALERTREALAEKELIAAELAGQD